MIAGRNGVFGYSINYAVEIVVLFRILGVKVKMAQIPSAFDFLCVNVFHLDRRQFPPFRKLGVYVLPLKKQSTNKSQNNIDSFHN